MKVFSKVKLVYIFSVLMLIMVLFYFTNFFQSLENTYQDTTYQSDNPVDSRIVIIGMDETSLEKMGRWQDWKRSYYADLINKLIPGKPAAIGVDLIFGDHSGKPEEDAALVEAVKKAGNVVVPVQGMFENYTKSRSIIDAETVEEPFDELKKVATTGFINVMPDESDGILRKYLTKFNYKGKPVPSWDAEIYKMFLKNTGQSEEIKKIPTDAWGMADIQYIGGPGTFEEQPFYKVLNGEIPPEYFEGKIVLIGPYAVAVTKDQYYTSIDHSKPMYGIETHANVIQNLMEDRFKQTAPDYINVLIILFWGLVGFLIFRKLSPLKSGLILLGLIIVNFAVSILAYHNFGFIITFVYPVLSLIVLYLIILGFRYLQELLERKRITGVFGRYVAPQVVKEILKNGEEGLKLGGTRREITALFVDIRGFTPMSEKCQPEEVVEILNDYLNLCAESIFQFDGTLDKFIGDATMAIYNAPLDLEDHAFKAVQSAWAMKQGSQVLQKKLEEKFGRSVQFGIGLNTGFAVVGNIGSKARMDYTAIGDTVNTAARLESNSKPGQILMSQTTYEKVQDRVEASYLGEIKVKGKEQGVPIYQLDGIK